MYTMKEHTVQDYSYREFRGSDFSPSLLDPSPVTSDIYIDLNRPFRVFVRIDTGWRQWFYDTHRRLLPSQSSPYLVTHRRAFQLSFQ